MKLWELYPKADAPGYWGYDCYHGAVIRAKTEKDAREMMPTADEAPYHWDLKAGEKIVDDNPWLDPQRTACVQLTVAGEAEVIITDFHAG
jgi:hypothetical protein